MRLISGYKHVVETAQEIYDALEDSNVYEVIVMPGSYDFATPAITDLTFYSDQHVRFVGDVEFKNVRLRTETHKNNDYYESGGTSTVSWSSPTFEKSGGGDWPTMAAGWHLFARDAWYEWASSDVDSFNPTIDYHGNTLSGEYYALCKPTKGLFIEGALRLVVDDSPAPLDDHGYCALGGLAFSDLGRWRLEITRDADTALTTVMTGDWWIAATAQFCCNSVMPDITISHFLYTPAATSYAYFMTAWNCFQCMFPGVKVHNNAHSTAQDGDVWGVALWHCSGNVFERAIVSGLSRKSGDADDDLTGILLNGNCANNQLTGSVYGLYNSAGDIRPVTDEGTNNIINVSEEGS